MLGVVPSAGAAPSAADIKSQIEGLNQEVNEKKQQVESLNSKIEQYRSLVIEKKAEAASFQDQVGLLENQIAKTQVSIDITEKQIRAAELEIEQIDGEIVEKEAHIQQERRLLGGLARKLYRRQFGTSMLEMLLAHGSFSSFFDTLYAVAALQRDVNTTLGRLQDLRTGLTIERQAREEKKVAIADRKLQLEIERRKLEDEQLTKENLLAESKDSELRYRYVLAELQREQNEADYEIKNLERALREKIDISERLGSGDTVLSWPVEPARGLSALFHDPEYPFRNVFEHPAIDIRAYQSTPVRASAAGIVARAKNAGMGYSYVMIIHTNDISTVYGHLSKITVKEDTFVERGEIIGYSGGMPGTPGAGSLTTGPHLHFETRLRGIPVNPLNYLVNY
jgi:murein DD-endopeptidase MepM/ murein hydrolase activator NlpD